MNVNHITESKVGIATGRDLFGLEITTCNH